MRCPFRNVADRSRTKRNPSTVDAQATAPFDDVADDILIGVVDLFRIGILCRAEGD